MCSVGLSFSTSALLCASYCFCASLGSSSMKAGMGLLPSPPPPPLLLLPALMLGRSSFLLAVALLLVPGACGAIEVASQESLARPARGRASLASSAGGA